MFLFCSWGNMIFGRTHVVLVFHIACFTVLQCVHLLVEISPLILFRDLLGHPNVEDSITKTTQKKKKGTVLIAFGWGVCSLPTTGCVHLVYFFFSTHFRPLCGFPFFFLNICVYISVLCVCMFLCMYMHMCVWVCVEARGQPQLTFSGALSNSSEAALSLDFSSIIRLHLLSSKPQGSSHVPLQYWGYTCVDTSQACCMGSGIKLGVSGLWAFASCPITAGPFVNF